MKSIKKVAITGARGFVGKYLVERLSKNNILVKVNLRKRKKIISFIQALKKKNIFQI